MPPRKPKEPNDVFSFYLPITMATRLRNQAAALDRSVSNLLRYIIAGYFTEQDRAQRIRDRIMAHVLDIDHDLDQEEPEQDV